MKSEKLKSILKGIWAFCSYVFVPQRKTFGKWQSKEIRAYII